MSAFRREVKGSALALRGIEHAVRREKEQAPRKKMLFLSRIKLGGSSVKESPEPEKGSNRKLAHTH